MGSVKQNGLTRKSPFEDITPTETPTNSPFTSVTPSSPFVSDIPTEIGQQRVSSKLQTLPAEQPAFIKDQNIIDNIAYKESLKKGSIMQEAFTDAIAFPVSLLGGYQRMIGAYYSWLADRKIGKTKMGLTEALGNALLNKQIKIPEEELQYLISKQRGWVRLLYGKPKRYAPYAHESIRTGLQKVIYGADLYPVYMSEMKRKLLKVPIAGDLAWSTVKIINFVADVGTDVLLSGQIMGAVKLMPTIKASLQMSKSVEKAFESLAMDDRLLQSKEANALKMNDLRQNVETINQKHTNLQGLLGTADVLREQKKIIQSDINAPSLYRGQPKDFTEIQKVMQSDVKGNILLGQGVFTTSDINVAKSYGENIIRVKKPEEKILDFDRIGQDVFNAFGISEREIKNYNALISQGKHIAGEDIISGEMIYHSFKRRFTPAEFDSFSKTGYNPYVEAKERATEKLRQLGYQWIKHKGGIRSGGIKHDVYISLSDDALKVLESIESLKSKKSVSEQQLRTVNKVIKGAKPELLADVNAMSKTVSDTLNEVLDQVLIRKQTVREMRGAVKIDTSSDQHIVQVIDTAVNELEKAKGIKITPTVERLGETTVTSLQSVPTQISAINRGMSILDDLDEALKTQIQRAVYIEDIKAMTKPTGKFAEATRGFKTQTEEGAIAYQNMLREAKLSGLMNKQQIDRYAKAWSGNKVEKVEELGINDLKSVHESLKAFDNMKGDLNPIVQFAKAGVFVPDWMAMENLGLHAVHAGVDDAQMMIHKFMDSLHKEMNIQTRGFNELFHKKWGTDQDEFLSYLLDQGERGIFDPAQAGIPPDLMSKFNDAQINYMVGVRNKVKDFSDNVADMAIELGYMTKDVDTINNLKIQSTAYADQLAILNNSLKNAEKRSPEWYSIKGQIGDIKKAKKVADDKIESYPALYQENYYPYVKSLKGDIEQSAKAIREQNYKRVKGKESLEWTSNQPSRQDVYDRYGRGAFRRNIPLQINSPEFMKRLDDESLFSRRATEVVSTAMESELRKIFLEPAIRKGQALIDSLPVNDVSTQMHITFDRIARKSRNMEMLGDQSLNQWFYGKSKWIEKVTNGRWRSRERAWEHFANTLRQLGMSGTILGNFKVATKNLFQVMHTVPTIGATATYAGWESMFTQGGRRLLANMPVMIGRIPLEALDITKAGAWTTINKYGGFANLGIEKYVNCSASGNGAIWKIMTSNTAKMDQLGRYAVSKGYDPKSLHGFRFWDVMADAVDDGLFKDVMDSANMNVKFTQWSYHKHDMSPALSSASGKLFMMFQNWSQHYIGAYLPQLWKTLITGKSPITEAMGRNFKWYNYERYALLSHLSMLAGVIYLGSQLGFDMSWLYPTSQVPSGRLMGKNVPFGIPPPVATAVDLSIATLGQLVTGSLSNDNTAIDEATSRLLQYDIPSMIPTGVGVRTGIKVLTGEKPPQSIFMTVNQEKTSYEIGRTRGGRSRSR
jgi:hypothetical protein